MKNISPKANKKNLFSKFFADAKNFNRNNTSEKVVLDSHYFSAYRGKIVIRTLLKRSGSFGVLFISKYANKHKFPEDEVRHEYGHTKQLKYLGIVKYILCIGIPSLKEWGTDADYYRRPWEITADIYGEVCSRKHKTEHCEKGFGYLENSKARGSKVWKQIV